MIIASLVPRNSATFLVGIPFATSHATVAQRIGGNGPIDSSKLTRARQSCLDARLDRLAVECHVIGPGAAGRASEAMARTVDSALAPKSRRTFAGLPFLSPCRGKERPRIAV